MSELPDTAAAAPPDADVVERMAEAAVRDYDLAAQQRWVRRPMPTLEIVNERFQRHLRQELFQLLRRSADVSAEPLAVLPFGEFLQQLQGPCSLNVASLQPLRGQVLVAFESGVVSAAVDVMYGGSGHLQAGMQGRDFSAAEQRVIQRLVQSVCAAYGESWREIYPLTLAHERCETHPQFAAIAAPAEMTVVTRMQVALG
ncbi:MAG: flagellar motor switch protein FliM, partial [Comamonadaceae bacterium]